MTALLALLFGPVIALLNTINRKLDQLMGLVSINQDRLDEVATTVSEVADSLQEVIDNDNELDPADESALNAAVEKLQSVGPKVEETEEVVEGEETPPEEQP